MTGIIVTGHGRFASSLKSTIDLIAGEQSEVRYVDFLEDDSTETLENKLQDAVLQLHHVKDILFLTDLVGGTPFKTCVIISQNDKRSSGVISGANVPMLLEILFTRGKVEAKELIRMAIESGINGIKEFSDRL